LVESALEQLRTGGGLCCGGFAACPQRGLGDNNCIIVRYHPAKQQFAFVAAP